MQLGTDRCRPAWTYTTRGVLWHLQTGSPDYLVGEERRLDTKEVSYFCLDRDTGVPRWEGLVPGDRWWSGIEAVAGSVVLFHGFASPDMPLHRGVVAVSLASGVVVWNRPASRFLRVEGDTVVVLSEGPLAGSIGRVGLATGAAVEEWESSSVAAGGGSDAGLPGPYAEAAVDDPRLLVALRSVIPGTARKDSITAVQGEGYFVLAFCEPEAGAKEALFRSSLVVLGGEGWERLFSAVMQRAGRTAVTEPFFCQKGVLYFVKERSTLVAVPLRRA
jgi:Domain of unknown function (DUF4905)